MNAMEIFDSCDENWEYHKNNCSGFVKAVAAEFEIILSGNADRIIDQLKTDSNSWDITLDPAEAQELANFDQFVVAGLKADEHSTVRKEGHVAIIVTSSEFDGYPKGYWGSTSPGVAKKNTSIRYSWRSPDRDSVQYFIYRK